MLGYSTFNSVSGGDGVSGGTVLGNIFRGIGGALFGGTVGTGGTPASNGTEANNQAFWKNVGAGLAGSIATIFAGLFSKDANGNIQNPNGILTGGATPYYPTASAQFMSFLFPLAFLGGIFWAVKSLFFGDRKKRR